MKKVINWKTFLILSIACVITSICVMPYQLELSSDLREAINEQGINIYLAAFIQGLTIFPIAVFLGLLLSRKTGFKLPVLEGENKKEQLKSILLPSIKWGIISGILIIICCIPFLKLSLEMVALEANVNPWSALLASFYGGIAEEVLFRLFLMSLFVWIISKIIRKKELENVVIWIAIIVPSVLFGLGHLGITGALTEITAEVVIRAVLLNGVGSIIFSILYWKRGLESAIIAHFSTDIILHIIAPMVYRLFS